MHMRNVCVCVGGGAGAQAFRRSLGTPPMAWQGTWNVALVVRVHCMEHGVHTHLLGRPAEATLGRMRYNSSTRAVPPCSTTHLVERVGVVVDVDAVRQGKRDDQAHGGGVAAAGDVLQQQSSVRVADARAPQQRLGDDGWMPFTDRPERPTDEPPWSVRDAAMDGFTQPHTNAGIMRHIGLRAPDAGVPSARVTQRGCSCRFGIGKAPWRCSARCAAGTHSAVAAADAKGATQLALGAYHCN